MSAYWAISAENAKSILAMEPSDVPLDLSDYERLKGDGTPVDEAIFESLESNLLELSQTFSGALSKHQGNVFERDACVIVHKGLRHVPTSALTDREFWIRLSVGRFSHLIEWRHGKTGNRVDYRNYGLGQPVEGLLLRLWLRGEVGYDPNAEDPYEIARLGDQDLWRSHILRTRYGNVRSLARSLVKYHAALAVGTLKGLAHPRDIAKELKRVGANVYFEYLEPSECDTLIADIGSRLGTTEAGHEEIHQRVI